MISTIIEGLDLAAAQQLPTGARSGLAELRPVEGGTAPYVYSGSGSWTQIANDNAGTFSYWRLTSPVVEVDTDGPSCNDYFQATYQLRLVSMVDRALCGNVIDAARSASSAIRGADGGVAQALGLSIPRTSVTKVSVETDSRRVYQSEFGTAGDVPPSLTLIAIDVTFVAVGSAACFAPCEVPGSLLCLSIAKATWAKIKACMSEAQLAAAEADLCDGDPCDPTTVNGTEIEGQTVTVTQDGVEVGTVDPVTGAVVIDPCDPCDPTTVNGTESDTPTILVQQGGVNVGTLNPATGVHTVPDCPATDVDVTVNDTAFGTATGSTFNVPVVDGTGTAVGSKVGTDWVVPTAKSLCELVTEGTSAEVATCVTASGKRPGVLAELIPTVDEADTVAQVYNPMTVGQKAKVTELYYYDINVTVLGVPQTPITGVNPAVNNTLNITIS